MTEQQEVKFEEKTLQERQIEKLNESAELADKTSLEALKALPLKEEHYIKIENYVLKLREMERTYGQLKAEFEAYGASLAPSYFPGEEGLNLHIDVIGRTIRKIEKN